MPLPEVNEVQQTVHGNALKVSEAIVHSRRS